MGRMAELKATSIVLFIAYQEDDGGDCKARQGHQQVWLVVRELVHLVSNKLELLSVENFVLLREPQSSILYHSTISVCV